MENPLRDEASTSRSFLHLHPPSSPFSTPPSINQDLEGVAIVPADHLDTPQLATAIPFGGLAFEKAQEMRPNAHQPSNPGKFASNSNLNDKNSKMKFFEKTGVRKYLGAEKGLSPDSLLSPLGMTLDGQPIVFTVDRIVEASGPVGNNQENENLTRLERFRRWRNSVIERLRERWRSAMTCRGCRRGKTKEQTPGGGARGGGGGGGGRGWWRPACCRGIRSASRVAPETTTSCCRAEKTCGFLCSKSWCTLPSCACCRRFNCCRRSSDERRKSIRAKHSLTSVAPPPLSEAQKAKIPDVLVEHNSVMRGAIPCLPVPIAWFCLVWNVLLPGTGTIWSGLFNLCIGQPRFSQTASAKGRFGALIVNIIVGVSQAFTVLFCLVGWGWSIWWAVTMIRLARKWKRFKASEAANGDPEARGPEGVLPAPGVPTQALRGQERAR